jgi:hypothetical protein
VTIDVPNVLRLHFCETCLARALPQLASIRATLLQSIVVQYQHRREDRAEAEQL